MREWLPFRGTFGCVYFAARLRRGIWFGALACVPMVRFPDRGEGELARRVLAAAQDKIGRLQEKMRPFLVVGDMRRSNSSVVGGSVRRCVSGFLMKCTEHSYPHG